METLSRLVLGAGKISTDNFGDPNYSFSVFVDRSYLDGYYSSIKEIETCYLSMLQTEKMYQIFCAEDIFYFLDTYKFKFNRVFACRIFEHMWFDSGQIGRLLDACNQITYDDAQMEIIVPNVDILAKEVLDLQKSKNGNPSIFASIVLLLNTEFTNSESSPHGSVWSPTLAEYYIECEGGTWKIKKIETPVFVNGRNCYMKILLEKN